MGTAGILVGHLDTGWLGTAKTERILGDWTLQGYSAVGLCRDIWWLGTAGTLGGWALQGHLVVRHCRTLWLGAARTLCGWALQGCFVVGHCRDAIRSGPAVRVWAEGEDNIDCKI